MASANSKLLYAVGEALSILLSLSSSLSLAGATFAIFFLFAYYPRKQKMVFFLFQYLAKPGNENRSTKIDLVSNSGTPQFRSKTDSWQTQRAEHQTTEIDRVRAQGGTICVPPPLL